MPIGGMERFPRLNEATPVFVLKLNFSPPRVPTRFAAREDDGTVSL